MRESTRLTPHNNGFAEQDKMFGRVPRNILLTLVCSGLLFLSACKTSTENADAYVGGSPAWAALNQAYLDLQAVMKVMPSLGQNGLCNGSLGTAEDQPLPLSLRGLRPAQVSEVQQFLFERLSATTQYLHRDLANLVYLTSSPFAGTDPVAASDPSKNPPIGFHVNGVLGLSPETLRKTLFEHLLQLGGNPSFTSFTSAEAKIAAAGACVSVLADYAAPSFRYINFLYAKIFGRPPTPDEISAAIVSLAAGKADYESRAKLSLQLLESDEAQIYLLTRLGLRYMGDPLTAQDLSLFEACMKPRSQSSVTTEIDTLIFLTCMPAAGIKPGEDEFAWSLTLLGSDSFWEKRGSPDDPELAQIYFQVMLGRPPTEEELASQLSRLGQSVVASSAVLIRHQALREIINMPDFQRQAIREYYSDYLGRAPSDEETLQACGDAAICGGQTVTGDLRTLKSKLLSSEELWKKTRN